MNTAILGALKYSSELFYMEHFMETYPDIRWDGKEFWLLNGRIWEAKDPSEMDVLAQRAIECFPVESTADEEYMMENAALPKRKAMLESLRGHVYIKRESFDLHP